MNRILSESKEESVKVRVHDVLNKREAFDSEDHVIQQTEPENQDIVEKYEMDPVAPNADGMGIDHHANFSNEVTDLAHAFSTDPSVFFNDQRHNTYVPDANKWGEEADIMYQNKLNEKSYGIKEYNYEDTL